MKRGVTSETCFIQQYLIEGGLKLEVVNLANDAVSHLEGLCHVSPSLKIGYVCRELITLNSF